MVLFSANYVRKAIKPRLLGNRHHKFLRSPSPRVPARSSIIHSLRRKRETTQREPNSPPATLHRLLRRKKEEEQGERKKSDLIMIGIHEGPSTAGRYVGSILDKVESSKSQNRNSNTNITAANSPDPEDPSSPQTYLIVVTVLSTLLPLLCIILSIALGRRLWVKYRSEGYSGVVEREDTAQTSLRSREGGSRKSSRASRVTKETNSRDQLIPQTPGLEILVWTDSTVASPLEDHQQLATVEVITTDVSAEEEAAAAAAAGGASTPTPSTSTAPKPTTSLMQKSLGKQQLPLTQQLSHPETSSHHHHPQFLDATHPHNHRYLHLNNPHFRYSQRRTRSISAHDRSNGVLSKVSVSMRNHSLVVEVEDPPRRRSVSDISEGGKTKLMRTEAEVEPLSKHFLSKKKKDELIVKVDKSLELGVEGLSQADVIRSASPSPYPLSREGSPRPRGPSQDEGVIDLALRTVQVEPVETYPYEVVEHQDQEIQTVSLGNGNFGLSTSDLSLDSSGNTTYTYGNQVPYGGGYYGYPVTQGYPMDTRSRRLHVVVPLGHHSDEDPAEYRRGRVDRKASLPSSALEEYRPSRYARAQLGKQYSLPVMPIIRPARFTPMETNVSYREEDDSQETIEE
ncbi:uncharacterized protein LOC143025406 isoform X5 [Oratosquilla oratoria]|uniref:uncharacterized protein LOC143025406 isoform X5 n=1 Tax=Oratosquilla oratoria TaxID=337810 RepID=UPI003F772F72